MTNPGPRRHAASLEICQEAMALLHWSPVWTPSPPEMAGSYGRCSQGAASLRCEQKNAFLNENYEKSILLPILFSAIRMGKL